MNSQAKTSPAIQKSNERKAVAASSNRKLVPSQSSVGMLPIARLELQTLNIPERTEFKRCEAIIAKGWHTFVEVGKALTLIRDHRLYRADYKTFEAYCRLKWQ